MPVIARSRATLVRFSLCRRSADGEAGLRSHLSLAILASYPIAVVSLLVVTSVIPQQAGVLALAQIFLPHLVLAGPTRRVSRASSP